MSGTTAYPLTEQIRDTISVHGLSWSLAYYSKRIPRAELRILVRGALGL